MRQRVATGGYIRTLGVSLPKFDFRPRSDLLKNAAGQNPAREGFGKALQWSAAVVPCAAASGQSALSGQGAKKCLKGPKAVCKKPHAQEGDMKKESRSDQRCAVGKWKAELVGMKEKLPQKP